MLTTVITAIRAMAASAFWDGVGIIRRGDDGNTCILSLVLFPAGKRSIFLPLPLLFFVRRLKDVSLPQTMKLASLVAILLRLGSIVVFLYTLAASVAPVVARLAVQSDLPMSTSVLGLFTPMFALFVIIPLVMSVLVYIWSLPLGYLMTRDLE